MDRHEKQTRDLLRKIGAERIRVTGGHEVWRLPKGGIWVVPSSRSRSENRAWKNNLAGLKRKIAGAP